MAATAKLAPHKNRWVRILGVAFVMYVLSYIDRTNIAMAIPAMRTELGISASAIGWYGARDDELLTEAESGRPSFGFSVCSDWERAAVQAERFGVRVVRLRIGLVLGIEGGMLAQMLPPFEYGFGGAIGSGATDGLFGAAIAGRAGPSMGCGTSGCCTGGSAATDGGAAARCGGPAPGMTSARPT